MISPAQADRLYVNMYQRYLKDQAYERSVNVDQKLKLFRIVGHRTASVVSLANTNKLRNHLNFQRAWACLSVLHNHWMQCKVCSLF